jgi:hypothetical protein
MLQVSWFNTCKFYRGHIRSRSNIVISKQ